MAKTALTDHSSFVGMRPADFKRVHNLTYEQMSELLGTSYVTTVSVCKKFKFEQKNKRTWLACAYLDRAIQEGEISLGEFVA